MSGLAEGWNGWIGGLCFASWSEDGHRGSPGWLYDETLSAASP